MNNYYQSNAVYSELAKVNAENFKWVSGNAWILVYGDNLSVPKAIALVHGTSWAKNPQILKIVESLAVKNSLPFYNIEFDDHKESIITVRFSKVGYDQPEEISLDDLKKRFQDLGLPVTSGHCQKAINDASSSAYHKWQRSNLGAITVSDIDLIRINEEQVPIEIIELKRSYIPLDRWKPFTNDFANFNLIAKISAGAQANFYIAYNVRHKNPFFDDPANLSIFSFKEVNSPSHVKFVSFNEFAAGAYTHSIGGSL